MPQNNLPLIIGISIAISIVLFSLGYHKAIRDNTMDLEDSIEYIEWRMDNLPSIGTTISEDMTLRQFKDIYFGRQKEARIILSWEIQNICGIQEVKENVSYKHD